METRIIVILLISVCSIYPFFDNDILLSNMNNEEHWIYQYIVDDIKVYKMNNDSIPIIKLTKEIKSSNNIFEIVLDIKNYNQVISNKKIFTEQINMKASSDTLYAYQEITNLIPFVKNRRIIFKIFKVNDNRLDWKLLNIDDSLFDKYRERDSKILSYGAGSWEIQGNQLIHYYYINPEIKLPYFLIKKTAERNVIDIFKDVLYFSQSN